MTARHYGVPSQRWLIPKTQAKRRGLAFCPSLDLRCRHRIDHNQILGQRLVHAEIWPDTIFSVSTDQPRTSNRIK
jgi:hypothetical protein